MFAGLPLVPWPGRNFAIFDEFPGNAVAAADSEEVAHGWADIDAGIAVAVWLRCLSFENVLPIVCVEGAAVLPLGVAYFAAVVDGDPAALADGPPGSFVGFPIPWDDFRGLGVMPSARSDVVVGQGDVKGIELRCESGRSVSKALARVVNAPIVELPVRVPGTRVIRRRVTLAGSLANPENGSGDSSAPAMTLVGPWFRVLLDNTGLGWCLERTDHVGDRVTPVFQVAGME